MERYKPRAGFVIQAYRFALDPNATQEASLRSHCGAARVAYNWAVSWVTAAWWQRGAEGSYGIPDEQLTPWRSYSLPALRKAFNEAKRTDPRFSGWWEENSKEAYNTGLANAAAAFDNYARSKNGNRKGRRVGRPQRKSKRSASLSCRFTTGTIRTNDDRHVFLPRLGIIRTHESVRKLHQRASSGTARILSATVRFERGRWFVSFQTEVKRDLERVARPDVAVGVDLGVKVLAVLADSLGEIRQAPNPSHYENALVDLKRLSRRVSRRQGPDRRFGIKPSNRWLKAVSERNRAHYRIANLRADTLHKFTTALTREYGTVVVEDLNVAAMMRRNRHMARKLSDVSFGEIRRQITYKTRRNGTRTVVADRWHPSSKTCSGCGAVKAKLPLRVRVFRCDACGLVMDRDENAARNLVALAAACMTGTGVAGDRDVVETSKPRGADQKTRANRSSRKAETVRAGGATPVRKPRKETRDRHQGAEVLMLW